ncbi:MAG: hypothetical protein J6A91_02950 [Bacteroidales bacterium]|nr:hypothetical protein [Bacteroidales bacterium]
MKFGLIGHPIAHSLSPALFRAGYDGRYQYDLIETPDFELAYERFISGYDGINVTAPFKELAFRKADILSEECRRIGAANLLIKTPEGVKAYNSDYLGVRLWLWEVAEGLKRTPPTPSSWAPPPAARGVARFSVPLPPPRVLIVGLGGAGKAAAEAARSLGMEVRILNRTIYNNDIIPLGEFREEFRKADIVIYNLPVRIPQMDELSDEDFGAGQPKLVLEANYRNPSFDEELLSRMKKANPRARYTGGRTWLLLQALTGYELFTGEKPDLSRMSAQI